MDNKIPIRNIYYMLAYSYDALNFKEFKQVGKENFENLLELYATVLSLGIPVLIRGGLLKEYISYTRSSRVVRGKINMSDTIKSNSVIRKQLMIDFDEFSEDNNLNQIIKGTILKLMKLKEVPKPIKKKLFAQLPYFDNVSNIEIESSLWDHLIFTKQNKRYQFMIEICRYIHEHVLLDEQEKDTIIREIKDERRLSTLFEKFVYELYRKETNYSVTHNQISWQTDDGFSVALPAMLTDIVLHNNQNTLIIDTKFYANYMARKFENSEYKQLSNNLYQMFTYINNWNTRKNENVGGLILYAKTSDEQQPKHDYWIKGKSLSVKTIDLDIDFQEICSQLLSIANDSVNRIDSDELSEPLYD